MFYKNKLDQINNKKRNYFLRIIGNNANYNFFFFFLLLFIFTVVFIPIDFCIIYCKNEINSNRLIIIYILLLVLFLLLYILQGRIVIIGLK